MPKPNPFRTLPPTVTLPVYLTRTEVSDLAEVHPNTVTRWVSEGVLPVLRVGSRPLIPASAVLELMASGLEGCELDAFTAAAMPTAWDWPAQLRPAEVARYLGVSLSTVNRLIRSRALPRTGTVRSCRIPATAVAAWVDANTEPARVPLPTRR